jgi:hypothetical protein
MGWRPAVRAAEWRSEPGDFDNDGRRCPWVAEADDHQLHMGELGTGTLSNFSARATRYAAGAANAPSARRANRRTIFVLRLDTPFPHFP